MNDRQKALQAAHLLIESGEFRYICVALDRPYYLAGQTWAPEGSVERKIQTHIARELGDETTLGSWLHQEMGYYLDRNTLTLARLAWIDKMMEDFA